MPPCRASPVMAAAMACQRPPGGEDGSRHLEGAMGPAQLLARALDLIGPQRLAVGRGLALLGRRAVADDGLAGDQRRLVGTARPLDGTGNGLGIVPIDALR